MEYEERAENIRKLLYGVFGYGAISKAAREVGVTPSYLASILKGRYRSTPMLDRLEKLVENQL